MRTLSSMNSQERSDTFAKLLTPECGLKSCRPSPMKGTTIIRMIPEVAEDGTFRPMFTGKSAAGDQWSALAIENISTNVGLGTKCTVINTPSDRPALDQLNCPFSGAFIKLKHKQKTKAYPNKEMGDKIEALFQGVMKPGFKFPMDQPLTQAKDMVLAQCLVMQLNNAALPKPATKQVALLSSTTGEALQNLLAKCQKEGIDLFSPKNGRSIVLKPLAQRGTDVVIFDVELGTPIPLPEEACKKLWVPWDKALVKHTYDELMNMLISAIGDDVASLIFPEDVARLTRPKQAVAKTTPAPVAPPAVTQPAGPIASAPEVTGVATLEIDADAPAAEIGAEDVGAAVGGGQATPQTTEELEKMYAKLLDEDPSLGAG